MRHAYIVTYDVCEPNRLRRVYKYLLGQGEHIQLSVFRCELNDIELIQLRSELARLIHDSEDQVLLASLGPVQGRARTAIESIGKPYVDEERLAVVV